MIKKLIHIVKQLIIGPVAFILMIFPFVLIFGLIRTIFGSTNDGLVTIIVAGISIAISIPVYAFLEKTFMARFVGYLVDRLDI